MKQGHFQLRIAWKTNGETLYREAWVGKLGDIKRLESASVDLGALNIRIAWERGGGHKKLRDGVKGRSKEALVSN